jgi:5-methylcytosine-specific restriction endonuclease McrBC regulatory subunit McrC
MSLHCVEGVSVVVPGAAFEFVDIDRAEQACDAYNHALGDVYRVHGLASFSVVVSEHRLGLTLSVSDRCGFASTGPDRDGQVLHWTNEPKIARTDWLGLFALAEGWTEFKLDRRRSTDRAARSDESFVDLLVAAYLHAVERLLSVEPDGVERPGGGLRRAYDERRETLRGRVKGRLLVAPYMRELGRGRPDRAPCRFHLFDLDNLFNRALRWGLHMCMRMPLRRESTALRERARALDARFGGVSWQRCTPSDLPRLRRPPAGLRAYERTGALPIARFLLANMHASQHAGRAGVPGFSFAMHSLFERAFAEAVAGQVGRPVRSVAQKEWAFRVEGGVEKAGKSFRPDVVVRGQQAPDPVTYVFDTKWKAALGRGPSAEGLEREDQLVIKDGVVIANADVFQIIAYGEMARRRSDERVVAGLVYPVVGEGPFTPGRLRWSEGRSTPGADRLSVWVIPWPVGDGVATMGRREALMLAIQECAANAAPTADVHGSEDT